MIWTYLRRLVGFAFRAFQWRVDTMQILAASLIPAALNALGVEMPELSGQAALTYIGYAAMTYVVLRLVCAPYFLWKDDQAKIKGLKNDLDAPWRERREAFERQITQDCIALSTIVDDMRVRALEMDVAGPKCAADMFRQSNAHIARMRMVPGFNEVWVPFSQHVFSFVLRKPESSAFEDQDAYFDAVMAYMGENWRDMNAAQDRVMAFLTRGSRDSSMQTAELPQPLGPEDTPEGTPP